MWFTDLIPSDVTFKEELKLSEATLVLLVDIRGHTCVMKVYRRLSPEESKHPHREIDIYTCERKAYERLSQCGLCDRGLIPKYYGSIENIELKFWQPLLASFRDKEYPPNAIFLEYIPDMRIFWLDTYSKERAEGFVHGIREIHKAGVMHDDPHPRNMMVFDKDPGRVMWIDFDRAQVDDGVFYSPKTIRKDLQEEDEIVNEIGQMLDEDVRLGKINKCAIFT